MNPKVTVLMPVFNRERFAGEAIRSVLEQDFDDFELLLVDDGSTDRTPEVLQTWKERDPRVVVLTLAENQGITAALNAGLAHARGTYVARLDSDDLMTPGRLAAQVPVLDAHPEVVLVSCAFDIVDPDGNRLHTWREGGPHEVAAFLLHFFSVVGHGTVMFRLADVREAGGYRQVFACEDYDLWVRLLRRGRIEMLPRIGMTKRTGHQSRPPRNSKHASWSGIMRSSLEPYLRRAVSDAEIAALINLWRQQNEPVRNSTIADDLMFEAFGWFRKQVPDRALQARVRRRIASQWSSAARYAARRGHPLEAMTYLARGARWLFRPRTTATRVLA